MFGICAEYLFDTCLDYMFDKYTLYQPGLWWHMFPWLAWQRRTDFLQEWNLTKVSSDSSSFLTILMSDHVLLNLIICLDDPVYKQICFYDNDHLLSSVLMILITYFNDPVVLLWWYWLSVIICFDDPDHLFWWSWLSVLMKMIICLSVCLSFLSLHACPGSPEAQSSSKLYYSYTKLYYTKLYCTWLHKALLYARHH